MTELAIGYEHPPVVERLAPLWAQVDAVQFESRFEDWRELVEREFPVYEPLKEWLLQIEEKEGIPFINAMKPEVKVTHRFSKKSSKDGFDWSIRCPAGQFTMNMHSDLEKKASPRRYDNLRDGFSAWMPRWVDNFGVDKFDSLRLHYVNLLDRTTIPARCRIARGEMLQDAAQEAFRLLMAHWEKTPAKRR